MEIEIVHAPHPGQPHRLCPVPVGQREPFAAAGPEVSRVAGALAETREFTGEASQTLLVPTLEGQWLWVGLGEPEALTRPRFCEAVAKGFNELRQAGAAEISLLLPDRLPWAADEAARFAVEALWMAGYTFDRHRTRAKPRPKCEIELVASDAAAAARGIDRGEIVGRAIALARDLINEPAAIATPAYVTERAREVAGRLGAKVRVIEGDDLERQGYGAIHTVGRAAEHPPALVALEWGESESPVVALVGKGVTFDTGGLDIKTSQFMALMKKDMGGAATVLGAFQAIAELGLPVRLIAVLGLAENAVGPRAYRPGDILRSKSGLTIEITNTDAEGRVVLADALVLAREFEPDYLVDFATLTGACRIALGKEVMGLFCDDPALTAALRQSGEFTGDAVWPLPLWAPYKKKMESQVADLVNAAPDGMAGAVTAALFLQEFAGPVAWAHLDCYAWSDGDSPLFPKGGSGVGIRLMADFVERLING